MRHGDKNKKLSRRKGPREALMISLAESLILKGKIRTTEVKAKALRPLVEKLVTRAKNETLSSARLLSRKLGNRALTKVRGDIKKNMLSRKGGYTRITKLPTRRSDGSRMAVIEFVE